MQYMYYVEELYRIEFIRNPDDVLQTVNNSECNVACFMYLNISHHVLENLIHLYPRKSGRFKGSIMQNCYRYCKMTNI